VGECERRESRRRLSVSPRVSSSTSLARFFSKSLQPFRLLAPPRPSLSLQTLLTGDGRRLDGHGGGGGRRGGDGGRGGGLKGN